MLRLSTDETLSREQHAALLEALQRRGVASRPGVGSPSAHLTTLEGLTRGQQPQGSAHAVVVVAGPLGGEHAPALGRLPPALLLAAREEGGVPSEWELQLLQRLLSGLPLLPEGARRMTLDRVGDLHEAAQAAGEAARAAGGRRAAVDLASDVMHELAANALLDAPANPDGTPRYAHARDKVQRVAPEDACTVAFVADDRRIFLEATDRFGRLTASPFLKAVGTLGNRAQVQSEGGGAGLGMRRMIEHSDAIVARVVPGRQSKVMCVVDLGEARRRAHNPKSLLLMWERG